MTADMVTIMVISSQTVRFKILISLGSVFSDISALKSLSYLISSLTDTPDMLDSISLWLLSSTTWLPPWISSTTFVAIYFVVAIILVSSNLES